MNDLKLFSGNANQALASEISAYLKIPVGAAEVGRFRDGEISVKICENVRGADVFILQSTHSSSDNLMELLIMIDAIKRASAKQVTAVISYFGYARQDRKDQPRVPITAKLVANLISTAGADRIVTLDLHAAQIQGFFDIPFDHLYSSLVFTKYLKDMEISDLVVVAPDAGSIEMARAYAKRLGAGLALVDKRRPKPDVAEVMNIIGEVKDKNILIRDDMIDTGGTIIRAAEALRKKRAKKIYAACTHPVLSEDAAQKIENSPIECLFVTNTIPVPEEKRSPKIVVLSVAELLGEAILRIHEERSISSLFD
ncbi:MAG: ribose-phosphate diphosphokinase [bacterium]